MSGYALVSIIHSEESVIFLKLYLCLALLSVLYTMCISSNMSQLVGLGGLEPPTSRLSGVCSNQLSYEPISSARGRRLSRLPLSPFCAMQSFHFTQLRVHSALWFRKLCARLVCRFNRLVEMNGIEPMTPCLQSRCSPSWATPPYSIEHEASLRWCGFLHSLEVPFQGLQN